MPPGNSDAAVPSEKKETKKVERSYLASAVDSINPWNINRSTTPTPKDAASKPKPIVPTVPTAAKKADDHSTNTFYGQSFKKYPPECPPLNVMWFHAVDVPKRKPNFLKSKKEDDGAKQTPPKKFVAFSKNDSRSIENAYQKLLEGLEDERGNGSANPPARSRSRRRRAVSSEDKTNTTIDKDDDGPRSGLRVPVNEDFLFDVDIEERELAPVYWLGPIYEIRRGSWFYQEGSTLRPCEENLAAQLEEGYLKIKPWEYPIRMRSNSGLHDVTPKASSENLKATAKSQTDSSLKPQPTLPATQHQPQTYRLFGTYMNSIATYQDSSTAWLSSESVFAWVTSTVYQRFAGGGYMNGVKLVRGYSEPGKAKDGKDGKRPTTPTTATLPPEKGDDKQEKALKRRSAPPSTRSDNATDRDDEDNEIATEAERRGNRLKRQFASFVETSEDPEKQEEQIRKREEQEIQDDYNDQDGETQGREIEHLVLVTHGIGQLLGLRMESVNFVHDVNILRKTIKAVYTHSADLKTLNKDGENGPGNCKIQVLPVCWRHLLDFPKRKKKGETDLGDVADDEDEYPSLEDITIEGVAFARSLISDLALDVLLYQSAYREQIAEIVLKESNRIHKLFMERNPEFKGKVHIIAHSLGSAIMFDILCRQKARPQPIETTLRNPLRFFTSQERFEPPRDPRELAFDFDVENFYCLGSPIGLFQMLKGRTVGARSNPNAIPSESPLNTEYVEDTFLSSTVGTEQHLSAITGLPFSVSSPKVGQLFNIFHPSDPISYRLEPLISPAMSSLKPQVLPYTKKGIFGAVAPQGLSGLGVKVGQSVSGLWSSFSAGIASNILNRSLGLTNQDVANFNANNNPSQPLPPGAGTNIVGGGVIDINAQSEKTDARKKALARQNSSGGSDGNSGTLIDDDLETLYARFQKKRIEEHKNSASRAEEGQELGEAWAAEELKAQKLRREEAKVLALNRNGRVDYSIQESALDFNPINTIASHMSYWQDEDVSHFMISQLLSKKDNKHKAETQATVRI
ncbi:DDHD domain-containing protein [Annulohypoxylon bovei var. microspora]|nr:DDHD domain-containing protein [Annulohypoxylon bovei var. microspora]